MGRGLNLPRRPDLIPSLMATPDEIARSRREFAIFLKSARDHLRMTQPQMAKCLRIHVKTYRNWEWEKTTARGPEKTAVEQAIAALTLAANTPWKFSAAKPGQAHHSPAKEPGV